MWTQINSLPAFSSPQTRRAISSAANSAAPAAHEQFHHLVCGQRRLCAARRFHTGYTISADTADTMRYATYAGMRTDALLPLDMERVSGFAVAISGETTKIAVTESAATRRRGGGGGRR